MNHIHANVTDDELIHAVFMDGFFQSTDNYGQQNWYQTQDITFDTLVRIKREYDFVEVVRRSKSLAFEIERSMTGSILRKSTLLARYFYELLETPKGDTPPKHELSEHSEILGDTAIKLNLPNVQFTGNPLAIINADGLLEGELVNAFITRLREAARRKLFKTAADERKRQVSQCFHSFRRYLVHQVENNPGLNVLRADFGYEPVRQGEIALKESTSHVESLTQVLEGEFASSITGYWWKREHLMEIGYRYHFVLFVGMHASHTDQVALVQAIGNRWSTISNGRGTAFNYINDPRNYRSWGCGQLWHLLDNRNSLLQGVKLMLAKDAYLRLKQVQSIKNIGMGGLQRPGKCGQEVKSVSHQLSSAQHELTFPRLSLAWSSGAN